jgi:hypothetical protein
MSNTEKSSELSTSDELLRCPFCASAARVVQTDGPGKETYYTVMCHGQDCCVEIGYWETMNTAKSKWNTRLGIEFKP